MKVTIDLLKAAKLWTVTVVTLTLVMSGYDLAADKASVVIGYIAATLVVMLWLVGIRWVFK